MLVSSVSSARRIEPRNDQRQAEQLHQREGGDRPAASRLADERQPLP
jgi:hypothetical protein